MSTTPNLYTPLRSPSPVDSSSDDLNELSLEQELAQLERPHFLDYTQVGIPYPANDQPPPIPPRYPLTNSLPLNRHSSIPVKMIRSADNVPSYDSNAPASGKKHFLDENPIRPDYVYDRPHRSLDREHERKEHQEGNAIKMQFDARRHSADRQKHKKAKEPSYTMSRFLETDDGLNQYNDNEVQLSDVNLCTNTSDRSDNYNSGDDRVYSLLSMVGCRNPIEMSKKFLDLSKTPHTCANLRHSPCISLLVQMIHCGADDLTRQHAREALRNVVNYHPDDKVGRREAKVLRYIEQIMDYCDLLKKFKDNESDSKALDSDSHPLQAMSSLMKVSFDEEHRHSMCNLGALQAIANLLYYDHAVHGTNPNDAKCISLRRYAGMALTNLTFGDGNNKALLCANRDFMEALVGQINTDADDLLQVTANVLRNLSWRADSNMKTVLNEIGTVTALTMAAMKNKNENTLRAILSALWNLSAHCSNNKAEFCMVDGALLFLVEMLTYESPSKTLSIVENAGGILRNVSSHIAVNENFRKILRQRNCLGILLQQLKSESLTIVSNACGTLWNLSARCAEDQKFLWDNGAVPMLRSLIHSKHRMISDGSKVALKNLVNFRPGEMNRSGLDPVAKMMGLKELPTLSARKQRALEDELDENLSETCENIEVTKTPPPLAHQKAPKSFTVVERDQQQMERSFAYSSLQCNGRDSDERSKVNNEFWETKSFQSNSSHDFNQPAVQHTGTIPKRTIQVDETEANTVPPDQITNFSLVYSETHPEIRDVEAQKNRTFSVAEEDTVKCYDNEGTPHLSTATSITDLRPLPKHPVAHNMHRNSKSGRTTTENSGINTPERPINYCEEGTPAYFSRRDSFSSLHEEAEFIQDNIELTHKPNQLNILPAHKNDGTDMRPHDLNASAQSNDQICNVDRSRHDYDNNSSNNCTVPTTPGECASKTVTFNEFNLETPMMFSRHSSLGSLASHEPPLNDDIGSVISETSRMPSGIISPSEIPDSPSQTMPPSPRQKHSHSRDNATNQRRLPFEDEIRTFGVENTPALISCATSLSNLSLDDEPKIANDLLIKEMRLMHHASDEQDDEQNAIASTSADQSDANPIFDSNERNNCDAGEALSDSDDSINDDDSLLKNCISLGIQAKKIEDIKSPPALPEPNDILPDDSSSDDEDPVDLLEQCIRTGITKNAVMSDDSERLDIGGVKLTPQQIFKENPIGMLRKGGNPFVKNNFDETDRFHIEDSPCNYSIASGLSDLTIGSHRAGPIKVHRLPSTKDNCDAGEAVSDSDESINDDGSLLKNCILMGIQAKTIEPVGDVKLPPPRSEPNNVLPDDSSSDDDGQVDLLEQCIRTGIMKKPVKPESSGRSENGYKLPPQHIIKENPIGMLRKGGNSFIETTYDETNRFHIEDIPYNHSIASGLSDLTVGSHKAGLLRVNRLPSIQSDANEETDGNLNGHRSLSPLSVDSEEGRQLLQQAFAAGQARILAREKSSNATSSQSSSAMTVQNVDLVRNQDRNADCDDSNSSISSIDSNDSNALLQQCIQIGMGKANQISASKSTTVTKSPSKVTVPNQMKKSQLPTPKASTSQPSSNHHRSRSAKRDQDDRQLRMDCINAGIERSIRSKSTAVEKSSPSKRIESEQLKNFPSKNAHTTSATVSHTVGATDVVKDKRKGTAYAHDQHQPVDRPAQTTTTTTTISKKDHEKNIILITDDIIEITAPAMAEIGYNNSALNTSMMSTKSHNSFNMGGDMSLLERSNEYPALLGQNESIYDSQNSSSVDMEVSNECLFENLSPPKMDKHKDPNLMLQSVERLTQELVSTAEYLRTNNSYDDDITITESKQTLSISNNTWNEDTNPNAISFPKMSKEAPVIASMHDDDATISELNGSRYEMANSEFIEDSTPINNKTFSESISDRKFDSNGLCFEIGGKVNQLNSGTYSCNGFDSHSTTSTMTNSTIIAMEAN
ncbi:adenomatous polyposis coli protein-like, partial [Sitodiplosis mosellana]|uniref:adenomatous polyposis coli protein-like n=1 Tax=Sitodiplosis mosellana TaxID=263140 RepID=UPI0024447CB6